MMDFCESKEYLLSLGNEVSAMKLGLENIRNLLAALGNPQNNFLKVQIAGTNGKGSVCAFLDAICLSAGIKTGVYTSPHLVSIRERVRINGTDISEEDFARHATTVRNTAERMLANGALEYRPTFFEQVTAIALIAFAEAKVELAILETGLGGRLDATTAANAEIAAITRIDIDHQEYLGNTIEEIASEKAAIIRSNTMAVIIGEQRKDVLKVLLDRCREFEIIPQAASKQYIQEFHIPSRSTTITEFDVKPPRELGVEPGLTGRHQIENAYTSVMIAGTLVNDFNVEISEDQVRLGIENARHPGRLEYDGRYLFDGAHNIGGARVLREFLDEFVTQPITLIFGAMKGKDIAEIAEILFPKADALILTRPENSRAASADEIVSFVPETIDRTKVFLTDTVEQGLMKADQLVGERGLILITGSLYLIGEAKKILNENMEFEI